MQFSLSKELVNPKECSEAEMTLQSCPELGLEDQVFIQIHQPVIDTGFPGRGHDLGLHDSLQPRIPKGANS